MTFEPCGHTVETSCGNSRSVTPKCPKPCGWTGECDHPCMQPCDSCDGNHDCRTNCKRELFCGHVCGVVCHLGPCPPCVKSCIVQCSHSRCPKPCCNACASCVELCDWECIHQGKCELACGAPCARLPCDLRCDKVLACGHKCPSVCGEDCPDIQFCAICCSEQVKNGFVDMICFETYGEHDIDSDPIIFLPCGHFFAVDSLDGLLELAKAYETGSTNGELLPLGDRVSENPHSCPNCRVPIHSVRIYGRITKYSVLKSLERKHAMHLHQTLKDLAKEKKKKNGVLRKLPQDIDRTPMRIVNEACRNLHKRFTVSMENPKSNTSILLGILLLLGEECLSRSKTFGDKVFGEATKSFEEGITVATKEEYLKKGATLRLNYVSFLARWLGETGVRQLIREHLDFVLCLSKTKFPDLVGRARILEQKIFSTISDQKMREVITAMKREPYTGYDYGTGANEHWYECPNGHPYFIGECGQAMQTSTCPECGEIVGGQSYQLATTNRRWQEVDSS